MKVLISIALSVAATIAQAQAGQYVLLSADAESRISEARKAPPHQPAKSFESAGIQRENAATMAVSLVDDGDTLILPPIASRTTQAPMRVLRIAVQWSF
jgi:hypothetical protein